MFFRMPRAKNWLLYLKQPDGSVEIVDTMNGDSFTTDVQGAAFLQRLDGNTPPSCIDPELSIAGSLAMVRQLEECGLLRKGRCIPQGLGSVMLTLHIFRNRHTASFVPALLNDLLIAFWFPFLCLGLWLLPGVALTASLPDRVLPWSLAALALSMPLHELGHALAGFAYGADMFEYGVQLHFFLPGAYVLMSQHRVKNRLHRIQISAAGVEMNFLSFGIAMLTAFCFPADSGILYLFGYVSLFLAVLNLSFLEGTDGSAILEYLLGSYSLFSLTKRHFFRLSYHRKLLQRGLPGIMELLTCGTLVLLQLALPLFLLLNILEVIVSVL